VLEKNERVQTSACSALAVLEETAGSKIVPYVERILGTLVIALDSYRNKSLAILYDAIGTLSKAVGETMGDPRYVNTILPVLIAKWSSVRDDDPELVFSTEVRSFQYRIYILNRVNISA
jgi:transportin-1